jgi:tetratricopeptide (TPR) repeat protein/peptidoglycan/xylan/chitin deacetylase (PgdA/CDA1 family)
VSAGERTAAFLVVVILATAIPAWGRSLGQSALDDGVALYRQGQYQKALQSFQKAVDLDPSLTKAWENIGWAQHRLGNDREALRVWNTVLKLEPDNVASWNAVGEVQFAKEAWPAAAAAFERSVALRPDQRDVRLRLGQVEEKLGRPDAAAAQYRAILDKRPGDTKAASRLADLEESRGDLREAETVLREGLAAKPDPDGMLEKRLARVLAKEGDEAFEAERWDLAADFYREAASNDPERVLYLVNLGWAERKSGANDRAVDAWEQALGRGVTSPADLWRAVGDARRDEGRIADARQAYARAAQTDPGGGAAFYSLATIALAEGDVTGAVDSLRAMFANADSGEDDAARSADLFIRYDAVEAGLGLFEEIAKSPDREAIAGVALARLHAAQGGAAYRDGDTAAAGASYRKALEADPRNRAALRDYGWTLWREGDWTGVRRVWGEYISAYPERAEPHELMGRLELQHGDPKQAIEQAQQALAVEGDTRGPSVLLTKAYLADGKFHRARELGAGLATTYPDDLPVQTLYAETLWRNLDFPAAKIQWRKVLDMGGSSPRAMHYWLRSTYETGAYDEAVAAAEGLVASGKASEPVLRLLAEDALVRDDRAATVRWYLQLTRRFPERIGYWTALADVYRTTEDPRGVERVLQDALRRHPDSPELRLMFADVQRALGHPKRALAAYQELRASLGRNRSVFEGEVRSLNDCGRREDALALLREDGADYLDADELALEEASILEDMGRRGEAAVMRGRVTSPPAGTVDLPILLYHGIAEHERTLSVPFERFESEMQAIKDAGFTTITVSEMDAMLTGRATFPVKPILVTFDDARGDSFRYADPVLSRLGMKATMFVPTVRIVDESAFNADWATLRRLAQSGRWDFQGHGHLAHDPIAIDGDGGMAEFLVNRQWLADEQRLETHEEFVVRVEGDYATCFARLRDNLPEQNVVGYAFPFSEMGQLHGGNDPSALEVNETIYRKLYRYGFVQDSTGYNALMPGRNGPMLLRRLGVRREWDAERLLAHLASQAPIERARLDAAEADIANAKYRRAESALRGMIAANPRTYPAAGPALAQDLREQGREREAEHAYAKVPSGPAWGHPDTSRRRLANNLLWETDPLAGADTRGVSDSDGRDSLEFVGTGRYPLEASVDLSGSAGSVQFRDPDYSNLTGAQARIGADWVGSKGVGAGGWLRGRALGSGVNTLNGEATARVAVDGHRFVAGCGVTDVDTVGALLDGIQRRGCQASYDAIGRNWRSRARVAYGDLTDGNAILYGWGDGTVDVTRARHVAVGGRLEIGDSRETSPLYYAPTGLVTALGIVRYARTFLSGASLDVEAGLGPSRDDQASARLVGQAHVAWTQSWAARWRTTLVGDYGETPDYRRVGLSFSFGYRF